MMAHTNDEPGSIATCSSPAPIGTRAPAIEAARQELITRALTPELMCHGASGRRTPSSIASAHADLEPHSPTSALPRVALSYPSSAPADDAFPLIMPQVQVSQLKPFTEHGRRVGKLKVMFCGAPGSGKTKLLQTIAASEDVVYCDAVDPTCLAEIVEIKASTQPYPAWRLLGAATEPSGADVVMERNLTLVDTCVQTMSVAEEDSLATVIEYLEEQFRATSRVLGGATLLRPDEMISLVASSHDGSCLVDVVVYCIDRNLSDADMNAIRRLSTYTTVLPVVTKADFQEIRQLDRLADEIRSKLAETGFDTLFRKLQLDGEPESPDVFVVSCVDAEVEASMLMRDEHSFDHNQTDLHHLCATLFHDDSPARLRHLAAAKVVAYHTDSAVRPDSGHVNTEKALCRVQQQQQQQSQTTAFTTDHVNQHNLIQSRRERRSRLRLSAWAERMQSGYVLARATLREHPNPGASEKSADWIVSRLMDFDDDHHTQLPGQGCLGVVAKCQDRFTAVGEKCGGDDEEDERRRVKVNGRDPLGLLALRERWARRIRKGFSWLVEIGCGVGFCALCVAVFRVL